MTVRKRALAAGAVLGLAFASAPANADGPPRFPKPTTYRVGPERACRSHLVPISYPPGQTGPASEEIDIPGKPGLTAVALTSRTIRVTWSVAAITGKCETAGVILSVGHYSTWLPISAEVQTNGRLRGSKRITFPSVGPAPDIAIASALTRSGGRSRITGVLIRH
jgi:hypothetical protein